MSVVFCGICPHPPIMVPEVGRGRDKEVVKTQKAMLELGRRLKESGADTLVMITPHGTVFADGIGINFLPDLKGDLGQFGAPEVCFSLKNDLELASKIKELAAVKDITVVGVEEELASRHDLNSDLDHGITAPLYFIREAGVNLPLVQVSMGMLSLSMLYSFGVAVRDAALNLGKKVAVLASGDLSHRLTKDAPAGYDPYGVVFDQQIMELVSKVDVEGICDFDSELVDRAGECGLRPIVMMLGALDGTEVVSKVRAYEGPFGVGYMVAELQPGLPDQNRKIETKLLSYDIEKNDLKKSMESYPVRVARTALSRYYSNQEGKLYDLEEAPPEFANRRAGVFVSLKKNGQLRGCIGTIAPTCENIVVEIAENAMNAAIRDPRFFPVERVELAELDISIDILTDPEPVESLEELDVQKYGVIVSVGGKRGVLLPDLEGVNSVEEQVDIARQKAGIEPGEPLRLERFKVIRYQ